MPLSDVANYLRSLDDTVKDAFACVPGGDSLAKAFGFGPDPVSQSSYAPCSLRIPGALRRL